MVHFLPRSECCVEGVWPLWLELLYWSGSFLLSLAYLVNPLILWQAFRSGFFDRPLQIERIVLIYGAFVFSCAIGHLIEGIMPFFYPNYLLVAVWTWQTAGISWLANITLIIWILHRGMD
ncbi:MAG: hypothetical protein R3C02_16985 [Planctomycetaceae bacterium]